MRRAVICFLILVAGLPGLSAGAAAAPDTAGSPADTAADHVAPSPDVERDPIGSEPALPARVFSLPGEDLGYLVLGIVFVAIGLITLLLTVLRAASRDATIFLFGAMSCVWGFRFLLYTRLVPELLTGDPLSLQHVARGMTYFGASAAFGFALAYLGPGWRGSLRGVALFSLIFSCVASLLLVVNPDRDLLLPAFSVMILAGVGIVIANILHPDLRGRARQEGILAGFCVASLFFALENLRALGVVPVPFDVEWIGVVILYLTLGQLIAVRMFTNEQRLAAISQELATARKIQASLLPRQLPRISGLDMAVRFVPMTAVAGDIYDFIQIDESRIGILVADVSGHGVPAALIASMVKGAFRAQVERIQRPDRVLAGMNKILAGQLGRHFVTASCTFIDTEEGILRYSGAGHPPLLIHVRGGDGDVRLQQNGLILAQFADAEYSSVERSLTPGDRIMLYTDGIFEATNAGGEEFGIESLSRFPARHPDLPLDDFADSLLQAVADWSGPDGGNVLADDLTLVVVDVQNS